MTGTARDPDCRALAAAAVLEAGGGFDEDRLAAFLDAVARAAGQADRLQNRELERCWHDGAWAAGAGLSLPALVDVYLSGARLLWLDLSSRPEHRSTRTRLADAGASIFRAVDDALAQVAAGYADARRAMVQREEARRRDFVDDLLTGSGDVSLLLSRAEHYGLTLSAAHCVIVLGGEATVPDPSAAAADLEATVRAQQRDRPVLVAARQGRLVVVLPTTASTDRVRAPELKKITPALLRTAKRTGGRAQGRAIVSVSRARRGPGGVAACYREADEGFDLALALEWWDRVVHADELAVFRVLLRDRDSMVELVESVLGPLRAARGGAQPLVDTLHAYLSSGAIATEAARRLHLSVRAVTYRLGRIRMLTGYDPTDADHRLTLHVAVAGARLLRWGDADAQPSSSG